MDNTSIAQTSWQKNIESDSSKIIKKQGNKIAGIDYGDNIVSRKKNFDEEGNTIEDNSEGSGDGFMRAGSPDQINSFKSSAKNSHVQSPNPIFNLMNGGKPSLSPSYRAPPSQGATQNFYQASNLGSNTSNQVQMSQMPQMSQIHNDEPVRPTLFGSQTEENRNLMGEQNYEMNSNFSNMGEEQPVKLTYAEKQRRKEDLLAKLARLEAKGYKPIKVYSLTSELEEIETAYSKVLYQSKLDNAVKMQGKLLVGFCNVVEYLNTKYDPFNIYLKGWSEAVFEDLDSYEEVFEELYEKYKDTVDFGPEVKLAFLVIQSGATFHMTHKIAEKAEKFMPNFKDVMSKNPDLKKGFMKAAQNETTKNMEEEENPFSKMIKPFMNTFMGGGGGSKKDQKKPRLTKERKGMNYEDELLNGFKNHNSKLNKIDLSEINDPDELSDS